MNTSSDNQEYFIENIFEYFGNNTDQQNKEFAEKKNHWLLWHGTNYSNLISIMSRGLRIAPKNAHRHGSAFGEGLYFADMFSKAQMYSQGDDYHYILLCEVALGKIHNTLIMADSKIDPKQLQCDSVRGMGSQGPSLAQSVVKDGVVIPLGPITEYQKPFFAGHNPEDFTSIKHFCDFLKGKAKKSVPKKEEKKAKKGSKK